MKSASKIFKALLFGGLVLLVGVTAFPAHAQPLIQVYPYEGSYEPLAAYGLIDNCQDIVDRFYCQDIVDKRSLTIE